LRKRKSKGQKERWRVRELKGRVREGVGRK